MNPIVLGLQFGDEGKGLVVDWLTTKLYKPLVIRFSGGHQCGHTVVTDTHKHVFSNFGSGTLRGAPTYWSKYCTIEPIGLINELTKLQKIGVNPIIYIDEKCPITTPYEIEANKNLEATNHHGSCGVGFGTTIEREENHLSLTFLDLFYPSILNHKLDQLYIKDVFDTDRHIGRIEHFLECSKFLTMFKNIIRINQTEMLRRKLSDCIFEGSQGLLLDQNFGFFPNVTRSNTGCKNALELIKFENYEVYLVTRAYQTRHGNGFMTNEDLPHNIKINPEETNVENQYQGKFRRALLDVDLLEYAIQKDENIRLATYLSLVITCLDHIVNEYRFTYNGKIVNCNNEEDFVERIAGILNINDVYLSHSPNSKGIEKYESRTTKTII